jgi:hypothetical protein
LVYKNLNPDSKLKYKAFLMNVAKAWATDQMVAAELSRFVLPHPPEDGDRSSLRNVVGFFVFHIQDDG